MLQSEELTYNLKTINSLQTYTLCFDSRRSHSTKPSDENKYKPKHFMLIARVWDSYSENVHAAQRKDQLSNKSGLNMDFKFTARQKN